jgi:hypothetical protein
MGLYGVGKNSPLPLPYFLPISQPLGKNFSLIHSSKKKRQVIYSHAFHQRRVPLRVQPDSPGPLRERVHFLREGLLSKYIFSLSKPPLSVPKKKKHFPKEKKIFTLRLGLMDTAGMDDNYEPVRTKWIQDNQCFILTYSISELKSFEELTSMIRKIKVTKDFDSKNPIVVVGNMNDLGDEDRQVSEAEGIEFCSKEG